MGIACKLQPENESQRKVASQRYAELLAADSEKAEDVEELKRLMVCLGKTPADVVADQKVVHELPQLRATIAAARRSSPKIAPAQKAVADHAAETKRIVEERQTAANALSGEVSSLLADQERGRAAVKRIEELRAGTFNPMHKELLAHEQAESEAGL